MYMYFLRFISRSPEYKILSDSNPSILCTHSRMLAVIHVCCDGKMPPYGVTALPEYRCYLKQVFYSKQIDRYKNT